MARPTLAITLTQSDDCTTITLADTTADYGGGTVTTASVQSVVINVVNESTEAYFTYTFTVSSNVISAATVSLNGGTATSILAEMSSTAWPFITDVNEFDLWGDYDVTLPDFEDGVYQVDYTITRTTATAFTYTTSEMTIRDCDVCCCLAEKYTALEPDCDCADEKQKFADKINAFLVSANYAAQKGMTTKAVENLQYAIDLCDCENCGGC